MTNDNQLKSLKELEDYRFCVPSYQRGYRWGKQEVETLLKDIWDFWKDSNELLRGGAIAFKILIIAPFIVCNQ